jgi:hypothetical protein
METQKAAPHVEEPLAERAGFPGRGLLRYSCHKITLAGFLKKWWPLELSREIDTHLGLNIGIFGRAL